MLSRRCRVAPQTGRETMLRLQMDMGKLGVDSNNNNRAPLSLAVGNWHMGVVKLPPETRV